MKLILCSLMIIISVTHILSATNKKPENESDGTDIAAALDQITEEIKEMENNSSRNSNLLDGQQQQQQQQQRTVLSDIDKLKKIAAILETVGQAVIPAVVDSQTNAQKSDTAATDAGKYIPKTIKLFQQHHTNEANADDNYN